MNDADINIAAVDRYTSAHAGLGAVLAKIGVPWWGALGTSVAWELAENGFKRWRPELFPYSSSDSLQNASMDTAAVVLGWAVARHAISEGLDARGEAALDAAVGSTIGGWLGSVGFGLTVGERTQERTSRARLGYRIGGGVGGAAGAARRGPLEGAAGALGGGALGPVGAAVLAYLAAGA